MKTRHLLALALLAEIVPLTTSNADGSADPWRLSNALHLPAWLDLTGSHRTRYETLDGQFRSGRDGGDQMLAIRTTLRAELKYESLGATAELIDSRQALADSGTPIDTSMVNAFELSQAFGSFQWKGLFLGESKTEIRVGRQTLDVGSRRLVARNNFRNTVNAHTGVFALWDHEEGPSFRAFYFLPHNRLPSDAPSLLDNEVQYDQQSFDLQFWGLHSKWERLPLGASGELYLFGLSERDSIDLPSRDRELYTPGLRYFLARTGPGWDFDFESVVQLGRSRSSTVDTADLDHFAHFHHAEIGYTIEQEWSPRAALLFEYASGDERPFDNENNRFDTLYGGRRLDHGPSGIYGAFTRANIQSPGYSLGFKPASTVEAELKHRLYWLASDTDAWTTSGVRDPSGASSSFVGHQIEALVRWDILPGSVRVEMGAAHLFAGDFIDEAPNATHRGDSTYAYASVELRF